MREFIPRGRRLTTGLAVALAVAGCSSGDVGDGLVREAVSGKVTFNGQPLKSAVIQFLPEDANSAGGSSGTILDGAYQIGKDRGPVAGGYRVAIASAEPVAEQAEPPPPGEAPKPKPDPIPKRYNAQTTLNAEIKAGVANVVDFALDGKK